MVTAKLYIEGGGDGRQRGSKELTPRFREAWKEFFSSAGLGRRVSIVRGGGRTQTFKLFVTAISRPTPGTVPILLVDSEGAVQACDSAWQHLKRRDSWDRPTDASGDQAFLMVQAMETWLLADHDTLRDFFGSRFRENALRQWPQMEEVPKEEVFGVLDRATRGCPRPYAKGKISFDLLSRTRPACVETACPHAKQLMDRLRAL